MGSVHRCLFCTVTHFCDVALRLPLRQWFTYRLPEALAAQARPGMRALVPLRKEAVVGIIGAVHQKPPGMAIRDVLDIVDDAPRLTPELLELGAWMAEYYFCSPGEALFALLPRGLKTGVETTFTHAPERVPTAGLKPAERKLCLYLAEHPATSRTELLKKFPQAGTAGRLERLAAQGTITERRRLLIRPLPPPSTTAYFWQGPATAEPTSLDPLAAFLLKAQGPVHATLLKENFPDAPRRLMQLARKNWVRAVDLPLPYEPELPPAEEKQGLVLTAPQQAASDAVTQALGSHQTFLLHGVTGSGKTEVYIRALRQALAAGGSALYLVPEIALAHHLLARLAPHFRRHVVVLHSGLGERARALAWRAVAEGRRTLIVGTRSAALAPAKHLRLVIVDEEQDPSFKQDDPAPRYHARDVAIWRARRHRAVCILGTATPSLESWANAQSGKYRLLELPQRIGGRELPRLVLVDRRREQPRIKGGLITPTLAERIAFLLAEKGQAILFLNRRGFSGALRCGRCGHVPGCPDCSVAFSYHRDRRQLRCHFCGRAESAPAICDQCRGTEFRYPRAGTQQVEEELAVLFPQARVARLDLDVAARRGKAADVLTAFGRRQFDILLGTQMVTKGLHFPHVALVGILNADLSLDLPDFRADERTLQLILQVAGRAGRGERPGEVYVQTFQPEQAVYRHAAANDYRGFAAAECALRQNLHYPPFRRLIAVVVRAVGDAQAEEAITKLAERLRRQAEPPFETMGPAPAPLRRLRGTYRWHLLLKTARVRATLSILAEALPRQTGRELRFNVDVDPVHLL